MNAGIYYYFYEWTKDFLEKSKRRRGGGISVWESMTAGAIAGAATALVTNPIWVVNVR